MSGMEPVVVSYALNSLWQVPLLFVVAWIAARVLRFAGSKAEHRVWVGSLLLQTLLPAISIFPWQRVRIAWPWHASAAIADGQVTVQTGDGARVAALLLPHGLMIALVVAYVLLTVYFVARLAWQCARLFLLMRRTEPVTLKGEAALSCTLWSRRFRLKRPITIVSSKDIFAPVTIGVVQNCVVLPAGVVSRLADADLDTAIAHEFAHIRRKDFLKNLGYEVLSLPISYHPCLWLTRQRIMETREMVCDEMAAGVSGSQEYSQSLLRLAALLLRGRPVRVPHAIGVFDANTLERRLMRLTEMKKPVSRLRVGVSVAACFVLAAAAATSALAMRVAVDPQSAAEQDNATKDAPTTVPAETMAANVISKVNPKYPQEAKERRIQGTVVLDAVVNKSGSVENLKVVSGPNELQQSSVDAVRQWKYKPYLLNGAPIEVKTTVHVTYSLQK